MNEWNADPYFQVTTRTIRTSAGPVEFPILFYDASSFQVVFFVPPGRIRQVVDPSQIRPLVIPGPGVPVFLNFYQYRDSSIGSYNEVALAIAGSPGAASASAGPRWRQIGAWILDLPVTTAAACSVGREIWGFPKFQANIQCFYQKGEFYGNITDKRTDQPILSLGGRPGFGLPAPCPDLQLWSRLKGSLLRSALNIRGKMLLCSRGSMRLEAGPTAHPMADHVRDLGLHGKRPFMVVRAGRYQARLHTGHPADSAQRRRA